MGAGGVMVILTNPIWMIKTRLQIQVAAPPDPNNEFRNYTGPVNAAKTIVKQEGFRALYRGFVPAMMLTSHGGVQFMTYEKLKSFFGYKTMYVGLGSEALELGRENERRGGNDGNEERCDECCCRGASLLANDAQRAAIVLTTNSLHH